MKRLLKFLCAVLALNFAMGFSTASAQTGHASGVLSMGEVMQFDKRTYSPNGLYFVIWQWDGNLVVYKKVGSGEPTNSNKHIWSTGTNKQGGNMAVFQADGNFVIYKGTTPLWSSGTDGSGQLGVILLDNDGSLIVSGPSGKRFRSSPDPEGVINPGQSCPALRQYGICVFPGTPTQFNGWVLACNIDDAQYQATLNRAVLGQCR